MPARAPCRRPPRWRRNEGEAHGEDAEQQTRPPGPGDRSAGAAAALALGSRPAAAAAVRQPAPGGVEQDAGRDDHGRAGHRPAAEGRAGRLHQADRHHGQVGRTSTGTACRRRSPPRRPPRPTSPTRPTSTGRGSASSASSAGSTRWSKYLDTKSMAADMPQLASFTVGRQGRRHPLRRLVHGDDGQQGPVRQGRHHRRCRRRWTSTPTDLKKIKTKGVVDAPAEHPVRRRRGPVDLLVRDDRRVRRHHPRRERASRSSPSPASPGYKAAAVDGRRDQERPGAARQHQRHRQPGPADADGQGRRWPASSPTTPATSARCTTCPSSSSVVGQVEYIPTPGRDRRRGQPEQPGRHRHPEGGQVPEGGREVHRVVHQRAAAGRLRRRQRPGKALADLPAAVAAVARSRR